MPNSCDHTILTVSNSIPDEKGTFYVTNSCNHIMLVAVFLAIVYTLVSGDDGHRGDAGTLRLHRFTREPVIPTDSYGQPE